MTNDKVQMPNEAQNPNENEAILALKHLDLGERILTFGFV